MIMNIAEDGTQREVIWEMSDYMTTRVQPTIRAAIFDLGGVIVDIDIDRTPRAWARSTGLDVEHVRRAFSSDRTYERMERGEIDACAFHAHVQDLLGCTMSFEEFDRGWNALYRGLMHGCEDLLASLKREIRLVALTNTNAAHAAWWVPMFPQLSVFERVFMSHLMGARKPEPAAFGQVLDYLQLPPAQTVFLDDNPDNVAAGRALGMQAIQVRSIAQAAGELASLGLLKG